MAVECDPGMPKRWFTPCLARHSTSTSAPVLMSLWLRSIAAIMPRPSPERNPRREGVRGIALGQKSSLSRCLLRGGRRTRRLAGGMPEAKGDEPDDRPDDIGQDIERVRVASDQRVSLTGLGEKGEQQARAKIRAVRLIEGAAHAQSQEKTANMPAWASLSSGPAGPSWARQRPGIQQSPTIRAVQVEARRTRRDIGRILLVPAAGGRSYLNHHLSIEDRTAITGP